MEKFDFLPLETKRLVIRYLVPEDNVKLAEMLCYDGFDFAKFMSIRVNEDIGITADMVADMRFIEQANESPYGDFFFAFLKDDNSDEGPLIGHFGHSEDAGGRDRLQYYILPKLRRQGFASEGYEALTKSLSDLGIHISFAEVLPEREESQKFLKSQGFSFRGEFNSSSEQIEGQLMHVFERDFN